MIAHEAEAAVQTVGPFRGGERIPTAATEAADLVHVPGADRRARSPRHDVLADAAQARSSRQRGRRAVDGDHRDVARASRRRPRTASRSSRGRSWPTQLRVVDAHRHGGARRRAVEGREREAHRHAVVVVGVDGARRASARGGVIARKSAPSSTVGAELAQLGRHRGDAVGFLDAPAGDVASACVGPSANSAITASVIAASGMWLQSRSIGRRAASAPRRTSSQSGAAVDLRRPSREPRRRSGCRPGSSRAPTPSMRTGASARRSRRREEVRRRRRVAFDVDARPASGSGCRPGS